MTGIEWEKIGLLKGLAPDELELVKPLFARREYGPALVVVREGEPGREMFVLVTGKVRIVKSMVLPEVASLALGGRETSKVLAVLTGEGHPVFGEMGLVSDSPRSATVETLELSSFLVTDRDKLYSLNEASPGLGCKLLKALCERMADMVRTSNAEVLKLTTALALVLSDRR